VSRRSTVRLRAGRRAIEVSRPDKLLFPDGITKADLALYYADVAPAMLPYLAGRPLNLERYPDGIEGQRIIQQRASGHFPSWIARAATPMRDGSAVEHVLANHPATLVYLANQGCITLHGWLSRADRLDRPDRLIIDLDPSDDDAAATRRAALELDATLRELGLQPYAMATGSRGYHLVVPLQRRAGFEQVRSFTRELAALAANRNPRLLTIEQRKAKRGGRVLIDVMRNAYGHTAVVPYAVRPRPGAPVATPLHEGELAERSTRPDRFTLKTVRRRLEREGDPWRGAAWKPQTLTRARRLLRQASEE